LRAVIISGGKVSDYVYIKSFVKTDDLVICADSGYEHAKKMGISPDIILGDFDSLSDIPTDIKVLRYPPEKDLTDTEIAVEYAFDNGCKEFLFLGATGGRLDHELTNIFLMKQISKRSGAATIIDELNKIRLVTDRLTITEPAGTFISLVPLTDCKGVTTFNLKFPLNDADLYVGKGLGVSNEMMDDQAEVIIKEGFLLVIAARD